MCVVRMGFAELVALGFWGRLTGRQRVGCHGWGLLSAHLLFKRHDAVEGVVSSIHIYINMYEPDTFAYHLTTSLS